MLKPLDSDALEPGGTSVLAAVGHSTRQDLPPNLDYLSTRALRHIKTIQRCIFTYDIKLPRLPPYRNTRSQILSWFIKVKLKWYKWGKNLEGREDA